MQHKKLLVLGAGASIGGQFNPINEYQDNIKMPSGAGFFYDILKQYNTDGSIKRYLNFIGMTYTNLYKYLKIAYDIDKNGFTPNDWKKLDLEKILSLIDIGSEMFVPNTKYSQWYKNLRDELMDIITFEITRRSLYKHCSLLDELFSRMTSYDSIYTFNYDLIAERSLIKNQSTQYTNYLDFMDNYEKQKSFLQKGIFLKLHGSIDWVSCKNKKCSLYNKVILNKEDAETFNISVYDSKCSSCGQRIHSVIIPPVSNKKQIQESNLFHKQWIIAKNQLVKFDRIVFYGYSFPSTDMYSEWLFRQVNFMIDDKKNKVKYIIDVINPEMKKRNGKTYRRYKELFASHTIIGYSSLEDYLSKENTFG
jgi:hypothetical protein